jgi:putative membrane protein
MSTIFAHAGENINNGFNGHMMDGGHWANDNGMIVFWFLLLVLVLAAVVMLLVLKNNESRNTSSSNALDALKQRYATGEITKKQYEDIKKDIS